MMVQVFCLHPGSVIAELSKSGNVPVLLGSTLDLTCRAYDCEIDSFVFEWYLNGVELPMSVVVAQELALSHITVEIRSESDLGNYTCNLLTHNSSASVIVYELGMYMHIYMYSYSMWHVMSNFVFTIPKAQSHTVWTKSFAGQNFCKLLNFANFTKKSFAF